MRFTYGTIRISATVAALLVIFFQQAVLAQRTVSGIQKFEVTDVQGVCNDNPTAAVRTFELASKPKVVRCDIVIAGGGMGGTAAAIRAAQAGLRVCVTEETDWIGGQLSAQGVSALDENYMVETSGATRLYQNLRKQIREHYRTLPGVGTDVSSDERLNPGDCWVSWLSFEPSVAIQKLDTLIDQATGDRPLTILRRYKIVRLKLAHGRIRSALAVNLDTGKFVELRAKLFLDATELGDLLPLAGVPYATGAEPQSETGEVHAPENPNPENVQDFTYPFVVELREGEKHVIPKPPMYDQFRDAGKFSFLGYKMFSNAPTPSGQSEYLPFWTYRRLIARDKFPGLFAHDLAMINWEANDTRGENLIDQPPAKQAERLAVGKNISLGFLYWLQTEAPRDDGGEGYPELMLRTDVLGTRDGLSKYPYIRESRRIKAEETIVEKDIAAATTPGARARIFNDSVGIGLYPIDIHGKQDVPGAGQSSSPFQIPLGALVQPTVRNLIPSCKNIGTTHITNGAYRLHPVEWAIGEAAGTLAAFCAKHHTTPEKVLRNQAEVRALQKTLIAFGAPLYWYDDLPTDHPNFAAIQFLSVCGIMRGSADSLSFDPEAEISTDDAAEVVARLGKQSKRRMLEGGSTTDASGLTRAQFAQEVYDSLIGKTKVAVF
ncbi:MAG TPA: FAD-dependent oxidoreductase [Candidatus Obscuribacterales bacterium]